MTPAPRRAEARLVVALAALAGLRVLVFAGAFPFFSNVDEHMHVDAALKYSRGYLPRPGTGGYEPEVVEWVALFGSPEYLWVEGSGAGPMPPPTWRKPRAERLRGIRDTRAFFKGRINLEAYQPPAYYAVAGAWLKLGRALGFDGGGLLYWLRSLNALAWCALLLVAYGFLREAYPANALVRLGVPLLLAVFPQDALYYVTPDAFSPLFAGAGFCLWLHLARRPQSSAWTYAAAGLAVAAAVLLKYSNATLLVVSGLCTAHLLATRPGARSLRDTGGRLALAWGVLALPIGGWLVRNQLVFADATGVAAKLAHMGWGTKRFAEYWDHPLFTASGLGTFAGELLATLWRGELAWHHVDLAWPAADAFYVASSALLVLLVALRLARGPDAGGARGVEAVALAELLAYGALLALLSLRFRFPDHGNPSAARPFFLQGRLMSGALLPLLLLYVRGIQLAASSLPARARPLAAWLGLGAVAALVAISELALSRDVFLSEFNWYHLP
ncbi:MAG: hypothetical protein V3U03_14840 [Myxococcota bacterium]